MIKTTIASICLILFAGAALASDSPATDTSIRELLAITDARNLLESMKGQMNGLTQTAMQEALQGRAQTPEVQAILDGMRTKMIAAINDSLNWDVLEPLYLRTYAASFTQNEMNGMIALYKTPAGQLLVKKMPLVMKNLMAEMPAMMKPMLEKMKSIQAETMQEMKALEESKEAKKEAK